MRNKAALVHHRRPVVVYNATGGSAIITAAQLQH
jgi:hypothetical protein